MNQPTYNPTEIWWPHPSAFDDLSVEFEDLGEEGALIHLDAPEGTECGDWLAYFQETPERQAAFEREFMRTLLEHAARVTNGESEITDGRQDHREEAEDDGTGSLS
jgi:hypothetical protein